MRISIARTLGLLSTITLASINLAADSILERGQDFRVFQTKSGSKYTELRNGMHYLENGNWNETVEEIVPEAGGAGSRRGPHKIHLSNSLMKRGAIEITTTDGKLLKATFAALRYFDSATGESVELGRAKESHLELIPPNQAIYRDVCDGLSADLLITYTSAGVESDLVLREAPPEPQKIGLAVESTRLQVWTEFFDTPAPKVSRNILRAEIDAEKRSKQVAPDFSDSIVDFGQIRFAPGTAYGTTSVHRAASDAASTKVGKDWLQQGDRSFLIESVEYPDAAADLAGLASVKSAKEARGFTIDFNTINTSTNSYTFASDNTYWIRPSATDPNVTNSFGFSGPVTFQPGAVIKFNNNSGLYFYGSVSMGSGNGPVIFTASSDDSIGDILPATTALTAPFATTAFWSYYIPYSNITLSRCEFRFCKTAVRFDANPGQAGTYTLNTCRFDNCNTGIYAGANCSVQANNPSMYAVTTQKTGAVDLNYSNITYSSTSSDGFDGLSFNDGHADTPDTIGAASAKYIVESINKNILIRDRSTGMQVETLSTDTFFGSGATDIRFFFDPTSARWYAVGINVAGAGQIYFAYSTGANPSGLTNPLNWHQVGALNANSSTGDTDYPCVGFDSNGIYICYRSNNATRAHSILAFRKSVLFAGTATSIPVIGFDGNSTYSTTVIRGISVHPAANYNALYPTDYSWVFLKHDTDPTISPTSSSYKGGGIFYKRLHWTSISSCVFYDTSWMEIPDDTIAYRTFLDLDADIYYSIPQGGGFSGLRTGGGLEGNGNGSRMCQPVIRLSKAYLALTVGLNNSSGTYVPPATSDRCGIQWMRFGIAGGASISLNSFGRIYDNSSTPVWYAIPSLAINCLGDVAIGYNGANASTYLSAYFSILKNNSSTATAPQLIRAGASQIGYSMGDNSGTSVDPSDDLSFWTFQEFGGFTSGNFDYGTRVQRIH